MQKMLKVCRMSRLTVSEFEKQTSSIDENLGNFWGCLPAIDRKKWFVKEAHNRYLLGIKELDDDDFLKLSQHWPDRDEKTNKPLKLMSSLCNYDMLSNSEFADNLFYSQIELRNMPFEQINSNFVTHLICRNEEVVDEKMFFSQSQKYF